MIVKRNGSNIFGAVLNAKEKKALDIEVRKEMAEYLRRNDAEIDATVLWVLSEELGFGPKRLKDFFDAFAPKVKELISRYEMPDEDASWLCTQKLKDMGIDIDAWEKESEAKN